MPDARLERLLWNGQAPPTAQAQLYTYVSRLRNALAPDVRLLRQRPGYRIRTGAARVDADEFARRAGLGRAELKRGKPVEALRQLDAALALWRGPALADVAEPLRLAESPRLAELRMSALEDRIDARLALDAPAQVLAKRNPQMTFIYVSGAGTDSTEQGRSMWARVKGKTENALFKLPFKAAYMFRPAGIQPLHGVRSKTVWVQAIYVVAAPLLSYLARTAPKYMTTSEQLGRAMIKVARDGYPKPILESEDITAI